MVGFLFPFDIYIENIIMGKVIRISESQLRRIIEKVVKEQTNVNEGLMSRLFGKPSVKDAASDSLRGQGFSHTGREDEGDYIMFQGQKFYPNDIEYADNYDMGEIPRIEGNKLIIANPMWRE